MCPSSNLQTRAANSWETHPVDFFVDYGLRVTINTDNRLITRTTVTDEYWVAHQQLGLSLEDVTTIIVSGFKSAFLPHRRKAALMRQVVEELEGLGVPPHHAYTNGRGDHL